MINRKRKNLFIKIFSSQKLLALLGLIIIILISLPLAKNVSRRYRINQEIKELEKEISAIVAPKRVVFLVLILIQKCLSIKLYQLNQKLMCM